MNSAPHLSFDYGGRAKMTRAVQDLGLRAVIVEHVRFADVQAVRCGYVPLRTGYGLAPQFIREYIFLALPSVIL
jgi:hypothetical protein